MKPTCQELADGIASEDFERLSWLERLRYRIHGWLCPPCRHYAKQLESIGELARKRFADAEPTSGEIDVMQRRCLESLKSRAKSPARETGDETNPDSD